MTVRRHVGTYIWDVQNTCLWVASNGSLVWVDSPYAIKAFESDMGRPWEDTGSDFILINAKVDTPDPLMLEVGSAMLEHYMQKRFDELIVLAEKGKFV